MRCKEHRARVDINLFAVGCIFGINGKHKSYFLMLPVGRSSLNRFPFGKYCAKNLTSVER